MQGYRFSALIASLGLAAAVSAPLAHAQLQAGQLVEMGGTAQAVAEECKTHSADQLAEMKQQQRSSLEPMGVSAEQFDTLFQAAYDRTRTEIKAASTEQKTQMCEQMKALEAAGRPG